MNPSRRPLLLLVSEPEANDAAEQLAQLAPQRIQAGSHPAELLSARAVVVFGSESTLSEPDIRADLDLLSSREVPVLWFGASGASLANELVSTDDVTELSERLDAVGLPSDPVTVNPAISHHDQTVLVSRFAANEGGEFIADGMTRELVRVLALLTGVRVWWSQMPQPLDRPANGDDEDWMSSALDDLGDRPQLIVQGTITRDADLVSVSVRLNDDQQRTIWSAHYEHDIQDLFALWRALAEDVLNAARERLGSADESESDTITPGTRNPAAYALYLEGMYEFGKDAPVPAARSVQLLDAAIQLDETYLAAHFGAIDALRRNEFWNPGVDVGSRIEQLIAAAERLDPDRSSPLWHFVDRIGGFHGQAIGNLPPREAFYSELIQTADHPARRVDHGRRADLRLYGSLLRQAGLYAPAEGYLLQAVAHDPFDPALRVMLAGTQALLGDLSSASRQISLSLSIKPDSAAAHVIRFIIATRAAQYDLAQDTLARIGPNYGEDFLQLGRLLLAYWQDRLEEAEAQATRRAYPQLMSMPASFRAIGHCVLGEPTLAVEALRRGLARGDQTATDFNIHLPLALRPSDWQGLREATGFDLLEAELGLDEAWRGFLRGRLSELADASGVTPVKQFDTSR